MSEKTEEDILIERLNRKYKGDKVVPYMGNNNLPSDKSEFEYDKDRVNIILKCSQDILYFAEHFFYIVSGGKKQKIQLHEYQKRGLRLFQKYNKTIFNTSRQCGKALALDTPIPTPNGWTTMGELKDGDVVYDENGKPCNVVYAHDVMYNRDCYEIEFDCGEKIIADGDHLWFTQDKNERKRNCNGSVKTTKEIFKKIISGNKPFHRIKRCIGVDGITQKLPLDPYILGYWLGDGHKNTSRISLGSQDFEEFISNLSWKNYSVINDKRNTVKYVTLLKENNTYFSHILKDLNILTKKRIPEIYLNSNKYQRLELLRGLMDSDGMVRHSGSCEIDLSNKELIYDVEKLILSLGYKTNITLRYPKKNTHNISYRLNFKAYDIVFKYKRKSEKQTFAVVDNRVNYHYIKNVKKIDSVPVRCITVDSKNALYLCGKNYIPTHNTTLMSIYALWLVTFYEYKKVLIVANKADTAKEILSRIKLAYEELPNWIKPSVSGWGKQIVEFGNGSDFRISATSSDAARGMTISALLLDECAHIDEHVLKEFWSAVKPTVSADPNARVLISSTPNGVGNLFHDLWEKAENGENKDWGTLTVKWDEIPGRTEEWANGERRDLGPELFEQEYECKFLESGGSNISEELYNELNAECIEPKIELPDYVGYKIYSEPDLENKIYVAGVDIAEGIGKCYSTIQVLDVTDMTKIEQVATYANNKIGPNEFAKQLNEIMKHWGKPPLAIERNNTGGGIVINTMDKDYNYPHLVSFAFKQGSFDYGHLKGITSQNNTKYNGVMNMFYYLKTQRRVKLRDFNTLKELNTFVRHKGSRWARKSEAYDDDRVDALVWAMLCIHELVAPQYFTISMWDENKKPFSLQPMYEIYGKKEGFRLGTAENNYGVDKIIMPIAGDYDPFMQEMNDAGWLLPDQYNERNFRSYEPSPFQFL